MGEQATLTKILLNSRERVRTKILIITTYDDSHDDLKKATRSTRALVGFIITNLDSTNRPTTGTDDP